jgi:hypothetical protein
MGPYRIELDAPIFNYFSGFGKRAEIMTAQTLIAKLSVEALNVGVVSELAGAKVDFHGQSFHWGR